MPPSSDSPVLEDVELSPQLTASTPDQHVPAAPPPANALTPPANVNTIASDTPALPAIVVTAPTPRPRKGKKRPANDAPNDQQVATKSKATLHEVVTHPLLPKSQILLRRDGPGEKWNCPFQGCTYIGQTTDAVKKHMRSACDKKPEASAAVVSLDTITDILALADLIVDLEHKLLICRLCSLAISPNATRIYDHIRQNHPHLQGLSIAPTVRLLKAHHGFEDISDWPSPRFLLAAIPQLLTFPGFRCTFAKCYFARPTRAEVIKHFGQDHHAADSLSAAIPATLQWVNRNNTQTYFPVNLKDSPSKADGPLRQLHMELEQRRAAPLVPDGHAATQEVVDWMVSQPLDSRFLQAMQVMQHFAHPGTTHEGLARLRTLSQPNSEAAAPSPLALDAGVTPCFATRVKRLLVHRFTRLVRSVQKRSRNVTEGFGLDQHSDLKDSTIESYATHWAVMIVSMLAVHHLTDEQAMTHGVTAARVCVQSVPGLRSKLAAFERTMDEATLGELNEALVTAPCSDPAPRLCGPVVFFTALATLTLRSDLAKFIEPRQYSQPLARAALLIRLELYARAIKEVEQVYPRDQEEESHEYYATLRDVVKAVVDKFGEQCPTSQLVEIRRCLGYTSHIEHEASVHLEFNVNDRSMNFRGHIYRQASFQDLARRIIDELQQRRRQLATIGGAIQRPEDRYFDMEFMRHLVDPHDSMGTNGSFLTHLPNQDTLRHVYTAVDVAHDHPMLSGDLISGTSDLVGTYFLAETEFLKVLMVALYFLGGNLPRWTELISSRVRESLHHKRSLYLDHATSLLYTVLEHSKNKRTDPDNKKIAQFYPRSVTECLVHYLVRDRPLLDVVRLARSSEGDTRLSTDDKNNLLFIAGNSGKLISAQSFRRCFQKLTQAAHLGDGGILPRDARHLVTAAGRYLGLEGVADMGQEEEEDDTFDLQANHAGAASLYAASKQSLATLSPEAFDRYRQASLSYHGFLGFEPEGDAAAYGALAAQRSTVPSLSRAAMVQALLEYTGQPSTTPDSMAFKSVYQRDTMLRLLEEQRVTSVFHRPKAIIAPTGAGKTALFVIPSLLAPPGDVTILFVPFRALLDQHVSKLRRSNIAAVEWTPGAHIPAAVRIVVISLDIAVHQGGQAIRKAFADCAITRIVFDESQEIVGSRHFRESFHELHCLAPLLDKQRILFVGATLTWDTAQVLPSMLGLEGSIYAPVVLRDQVIVNRHIHYDFRPFQAAEHAIADAVAFVKTVPGRVLVLARFKWTAEQLQEKVLAAVVGRPVLLHRTGQAAVPGATTPIQDFSLHPNAILIGTSALATGLDLPRIDAVMHVGLPYSLLDTIQGAGRLARAANAGGIYALFPTPLGANELARLREKDPHEYGFYFQQTVHDVVQDNSLCVYTALANAVQDDQKGSCLQIGLHRPCSRCAHSLARRAELERQAALARQAEQAQEAAQEPVNTQIAGVEANSFGPPLSVATGPLEPPLRLAQTREEEAERVVQGLSALAQLGSQRCLRCLLCGYQDFAKHSPARCRREGTMQWARFAARSSTLGDTLRQRVPAGLCCYLCSLPVKICQALSAVDSPACCGGIGQLSRDLARSLFASDDIYSFWKAQQGLSYTHHHAGYVIASSTKSHDLWERSLSVGGHATFSGSVLLSSVIQWCGVVLALVP